MQRVSRSTAVATLPSPPSGGTPGFFAKPDPVNGVPATVPGYEWFNWLQEEMAALAAMNGAALDGAQFTQARDAVNALLAAKPSQGQLQGQNYTAFATTGSSGTFVLTPSPAISAYAANQRFRVKFNAAGNGSDTINVSSKGAIAIKQYDSTGAKVAPVIASGQLADLEYDGTNFVILDPLPANSLTQTSADARYSRIGLAAVAYSANTTLTLSNAGQIIYFTGTTATFTLPLSNAAAGGQMQMIISNQGSGVLTLAMQGGNTSDISFLSLSPGQSLAVVNDGGTAWHHLWSEVGTTGPYSVGNATANTHAVNLGQFTTSQVKSTSGNQQLPGGLILKWGTTGSIANSATPTTITFPVAFPTACAYVNCIGTGTRGSAGEANNVINAVTASSFGIVSGNAATQTFLWFAIGY
jgi:hypothetical protein